MTIEAKPGESAGRGRPLSVELDDAILDAACAILTNKGYRGFSIDAVAKAARTTRAAVYRRWQTREDILIAALDHAMKVHSGAPIEPETLEALPDDQLLGLLRLVVQSFASIIGDSRASAVSVSVSAAMYGDEALRASVHAHHYNRRRPLELLMHHAQMRGLVRQDVALAVLMHVLVGAIQYRSSLLQERMDADYVEDVLRVILAG